jgi:formylmethanofuran dehydrogenase subunit E
MAPRKRASYPNSTGATPEEAARKGEPLVCAGCGKSLQDHWLILSNGKFICAKSLACWDKAKWMTS